MLRNLGAVRQLFSLSLFMVLAIAGSALASDPSGNPELVEAAEALMAEAEYERAEKKLEHLAQSKAMWLRGICLISLERRVEALKLFSDLLKKEPTFAAPEATSPKVLDVLNEARDALLQSGELKRLYAPMHYFVQDESSAGGGPIGRKLNLTLGNKGRAKEVARVTIRFRRAGTAHFYAADLDRDDVNEALFVAALPKLGSDASDDAGEIEYFIEGFCATSEMLFSVGSGSKPYSFSIATKLDLPRRPEKEKINSQPYIPIIASATVVTVVGIVVLAAVLSTPTRPM